MLGKVAHGGRPFQAKFDWLMMKGHFVKICEGANAGLA